MKGWAAALHWYGPKTLLRMQTRSGSKERAMLSQLDLLQLLQQSQRLFQEQGGAGFLADVQMLRQGVQAVVPGKNTRSVFVHGGEDHIAPLSAVREIAGAACRMPGCASARMPEHSCSTLSRSWC